MGSDGAKVAVVFNPNNARQFKRLLRAKEHSYRRFDPFRKNREKMIRQYVGAWYGENCAPDKVPLNFIELSVSIYSMHLVAQAPAVLVTTKWRNLKRSAEEVQEAIRKDIHATGLELAQERWVRDALFLMGILKVGIDQTEGQSHGNAFCEPVDFDEWVHDASAKEIEKAGFMGDRYRVGLDWAKDNQDFNAEARGKLVPMVDYSTNEDGGKRVEEIGGEMTAVEEVWQDQVELWDLWVPETRQLITVPDRGAHEKPLRVLDWPGPEEGPYHILAFSPVPSRPIPSAPMHHWYDLHILANKLFNKAARRAEAEKTVTAVGPGGEADARRVVEAADLDTLSVTDPKNIQQLRYGGAEGPLMALALQCRDIQSYQAGNLDVLGGLGASSSTLGQDQLLTAGAGRRMASYQKRVERALEGVLRALAWWRISDPLTEEVLPRKIPGTERYEMLRWRPETERGDFLQYQFSVTPHSTQYRSPEERMAALLQVLNQVYFPLMDRWEAMGVSISPERLFKRIEQYTGLEELGEILQSSGMLQGERLSEKNVRQAPHTVRENVRTQAPPNRQAGQQDLMKQLVGGLNPEMARGTRGGVG